MTRLALYQPDMAGNVGAVMRLCACMGVALDIIEPCGFPWNKKKIRSSAMDYLAEVTYERHESWDSFIEIYKEKRIVLMTTKADVSYSDFEFRKGDILLAGSESAGVPDFVHEAVDKHVTIPMQGAMRSLNIGMACAMALGEVGRQLG